LFSLAFALLKTPLEFRLSHNTLNPVSTKLHNDVQQLGEHIQPNREAIFPSLLGTAWESAFFALVLQKLSKYENYLAYNLLLLVGEVTNF
jgi:hypothetical protein